MSLDDVTTGGGWLWGRKAKGMTKEEYLRNCESGQEWKRAPGVSEEDIPARCLASWTRYEEENKERRGGARRKSIKRKSIKRKSMKRKSIKRKSMKRKSIKRKSMKRKNTRRRR